MTDYIDAHNHITSILEIDSIYNSYKVEHILNFTESKSKNQTIGLHPGYIDCEIPWDFIIELISHNPGILIGEVGLDKNYSLKEKQLEVFKKFLGISESYNRSVSIHCIKSWGKMLNTIHKDYNRDIPHMYHGYSGSYETLKNAIQGNSFFSFSLRELRKEKMKQIIKYIPSRKIMIESDMSDEAYKCIGSSEYLEGIKESYKLLSEIKGESLVDLKEIIKNNFTTFLQLGD